MLLQTLRGRCNRRRMTSCCLLIASFWLGALEEAYAARVEIPSDIVAGFNLPLTESGRAYPITVTLENAVASTRGMIEITQPNPGAKQEVHTVLPFVLPSPSVKRFRFYIPIERGRELNINVRFEDHIKPISVRLPVRWEEDGKRRVLSVGVTRAERRWTPAKGYDSAPVDASLLPDSPLGYDSVHAVLMSGREFQVLSRDVLAALRTWVDTGGRLLISNPLSEPTFRARVKAFCERDIAIDLSQPGINRLGAGWLCSSGFLDERETPFWVNDAGALRTLFPQFDINEGQHDVGWGVGFFYALFSGSRSLGAVGFMWLLVIIVFYVLTIGPVDWAISRRFKKPHLTWALFFGTIVLFSFIAFGYSRIVNVGKTQALFLNIVDTVGSPRMVRGMSRIGIYSAANKRYKLTPVRDNVMISAKENAMGAGSAAGVTIQLGAEPELNARIPVFSSKQFQAEWFGEWDAAVWREDTQDMAAFRLQFGGATVHSAYLAQQEGLLELHSEGPDAEGSIRLHRAYEDRRDWGTVVGEYAEKLHMPQHFRGWGANSDKALPNVDALKRYVICMSHPIDPALDPENFNKHWQLNQLHSSRDSFERKLSLVASLPQEDVLLLILDDGEAMTPLALESGAPDVVHLTCIRVRFPRAAAESSGSIPKQENE
ncbi:MAG: hypothetical protein ACI9OU_000157 [Candidatus Promineifilaceae bacterium]|jgi:hypothetical protein